MTRPKVTLLTQVFPPESNAGANRLGAMAAALSKTADLTVVTILPSYPTPQYHRSLETLAGHDEPQPYVVARLRAFHPHRGAFVLRALREMAMASRLGWRAARNGADVYVATSPSVFVGFSAVLVSILRRAPLVVDLRDLTWEYIADDARVPALLSALLRGMARLALRRAALVSVSSSGIRAAVEEFGIATDQIIDTPNGVSNEILERGLEMSDPSEPPDPVIVTYAGALGYYQGMGTLIDVAEAMPDVEFRLIGEGPERAALIDTIETRGITNVLLPGFLDRGTVFKHYSESDILFAQLRDLPVLGRAAFPSKPYEYMATGRPIVYAGAGITAEFLKETGSALVTEPENAEAIQRAIQRLIDDPDLRRSLGDAGRKAAPRYRRETVMKRFATAVIEIAAR